MNFKPDMKNQNLFRLQTQEIFIQPAPCQKTTYLLSEKNAWMILCVNIQQTQWKLKSP